MEVLADQVDRAGQFRVAAGGAHPHLVGQQVRELAGDGLVGVGQVADGAAQVLVRQPHVDFDHHLDNGSVSVKCARGWDKDKIAIGFQVDAPGLEKR